MANAWTLVIGIIISLIFILWIRGLLFKTGSIPKIIWTYWDSDELPEFVEMCIDKWRRLHPDWTIRVLTPDTVWRYTDADIFNYKFADTKPRTSDFVRLNVLAKHGGVWADASIVPMKSFDWVLDKQREGGYEFISYYRKQATLKPEYPVVESWFFACVPDCQFVKDWRDELEVMNSLGSDTDYKPNVQSRGVDIQNIPQPDYLNVYLSAQAVMQTKMTLEEIKEKIYVVEADDGPFRHSTRNNWDPPNAMKWLCGKTPADVPEMIKVYGLEREAIKADPELKCSYWIFD